MARPGEGQPEAATANRLPMLSGRIAAPAQPVGEGEGEGLGVRLPVLLGALTAEAPAPACSQLSSSFGARRSVGSPAARTQHQVGIVAAQATLRKQDGNFGRGHQQSAVARLGQHVGEAWLERQSGNGTSVPGNPAPGIDRAEPQQPLARFRKCSR